MFFPKGYVFGNEKSQRKIILVIGCRTYENKCHLSQYSIDLAPINDFLEKIEDANCSLLL